MIKIISAHILYAASIILSVIVFKNLWNWFLTPALPTGEIGLGHALGILLVIEFLFNSDILGLSKIKYIFDKPLKEFSVDHYFCSSLMHLISSLVFLGFGYFLSLKV